MMDKAVREWLIERKISEVEIFILDISGILRGKIIPCEKFLESSVRMPESAIAQTVTGDWGVQEDYVDEIDGDMELRPSIEGCFAVPWAEETNRADYLRLRQPQRRFDSLCTAQRAKKGHSLLSSKRVAADYCAGIGILSRQPR